MRILTSLVVVAALSGCAYQSGYIDPNGVWIAKGEPYAKGTCRSTAPYVMGAPGPVGLAGGPGLAGPQGAPGIAGPTGPEGPAGVAGPVGVVGPVGSVGMTGRGGSPGASGWSSMENVNFKYGSADLQQKCKDKLAVFKRLAGKLEQLGSAEARKRISNYFLLMPHSLILLSNVL